MNDITLTLTSQDSAEVRFTMDDLRATLLIADLEAICDLLYGKNHTMPLSIFISDAVSYYRRLMDHSEVK